MQSCCYHPRDYLTVAACSDFLFLLYHGAFPAIIICYVYIHIRNDCTAIGSLFISLSKLWTVIRSRAVLKFNCQRSLYPPSPSFLQLLCLISPNQISFDWFRLGGDFWSSSDNHSTSFIPMTRRVVVAYIPADVPSGLCRSAPSKILSLSLMLSWRSGDMQKAVNDLRSTGTYPCSRCL